MIAVLGANGFIGSRLTEYLHLTRFAAVRPIVRSFSSMAPLSRFNLDIRIADGFNAAALEEAFAGCDIIVNCIAGDPHTITGTIEPVYKAAQIAKVQRIVYLSSAMVHGQNPAPGTSEESKLEFRQPLPYNNAKVRAEKKLLRLRKKGKVEVVILRPGIVYGPRSVWVTRFASDILNGKAFLINKGKGICNSIYIDNLVHAIKLAITEEDIDGEAFLLRDAEQITWADLYKPIADYFGIALEIIHELQPPYRFSDDNNFFDSLNNSKFFKSILSPIPKKYRFLLYTAASQLINDETTTSPWRLRQTEEISVDLEKLLLFSCEVALPWKKAYKFLNYEPEVNFDEACRRTIEWMKFAGYPQSERKIKISSPELR